MLPVKPSPVNTTLHPFSSFSSNPSLSWKLFLAIPTTPNYLRNKKFKNNSFKLQRNNAINGELRVHKTSNNQPNNNNHDEPRVVFFDKNVMTHNKTPASSKLWSTANSNGNKKAPKSFRLWRNITHDEQSAFHFVFFISDWEKSKAQVTLCLFLFVYVFLWILFSILFVFQIRPEKF